MDISSLGPMGISLFLTLKLAVVTVILELLILFPLCWFLFQNKNKFLCVLIESLLTLPLFLPPTVIGFYYLVIFQQNEALTFNFLALVIVSFVSSMPLFIKNTLNGLEAVDKAEVELCCNLGATKSEIITKIYLPQMKLSLLRTITPCFAHIVGSFGALLMVGGSIPGKTKVISIYIFEKVESLQFEKAHVAGLVLLALALGLLLVLHLSSKEAPWKK